LLWNDPALAIDWGLSDEDAVLSGKDKIAPRLADLISPFVYHGDA
jgi:dTDP-4-dehydrorhamnose 3,5-epimerase